MLRLQRKTEKCQQTKQKIKLWMCKYTSDYMTIMEEWFHFIFEFALKDQQIKIHKKNQQPGRAIWINPLCSNIYFPACSDTVLKKHISWCAVAAINLTTSADTIKSTEGATEMDGVFWGSSKQFFPPVRLLTDHCNTAQHKELNTNRVEEHCWRLWVDQSGEDWGLEWCEVRSASIGRGKYSIYNRIGVTSSVPDRHAHCWRVIWGELCCRHHATIHCLYAIISLGQCLYLYIVFHQFT